MSRFTDALVFASIPRVFWILLPHWGKHGNAAVIHDWLCWTQERGRREVVSRALPTHGDAHNALVMVATS